MTCIGFTAVSKLSLSLLGPNVPRQSSATTQQRRLWAIVLGMLVVAMGGCSKLNTEYGHSYSRDATQSINGVSVLRQMCEVTGWNTNKITRLSGKAERMDAMFWFPVVHQTPGERSTEWFDDWLAQGDRTLVFVSQADYSAERNYYQQAMPKAAPKDRLEYRRRIARLTAEARSPLPKELSNGWFVLKSKDQHSESSRWTGPWTESLPVEPGKLTTTSIVRPYKPSKDQSLDSGAYYNDQVNPAEAIVDFEPLLETAQGDCLVARITSDRWPASQVLVVSTAQPLVNLSLLERSNQAIAETLIQELGPPGEAGFMRTGYAGARVPGGNDDELAAGMELLTLWPLSMVTMHLLIFLFVGLLVLAPIFGRAHHRPAESTGDFGNHISAVGELLQNSDDKTDARRRIAEYFIQVRQDPSSSWAQVPASDTSELNTPPNPYKE